MALAPTYPMRPTVDAEPSLVPHPDAANPVLTERDVTDRERPRGVADPFLAYEDGTYHLFFEVLSDDPSERRSVEDEAIGHATSEDGLEWEYDGVVLDDPGHLAYPHVFNWRGTWYMAPDSGSGTDKHFYGGIARVYRADDFPTDWRLVDRPIMRFGMSDPTPFLHDGTWYLLGGLSDDGGRILGGCLYYADGLLEAEWREHPASPIRDPAVPATEPNRTGRPGGRPIVHGDGVDVPFQDCVRHYGDKVRAIRITELSPTTYADVELPCSPIVEASRDGTWTGETMHHVDAGIAYAGVENLVAVDGSVRGYYGFSADDSPTEPNTGIGIYRLDR